MKQAILCAMLVATSTPAFAESAKDQHTPQVDPHDPYYHELRDLRLPPASQDDAPPAGIIKLLQRLQTDDSVVTIQI